MLTNPLKPLPVGESYFLYREIGIENTDFIKVIRCPGNPMLFSDRAISINEFSCEFHFFT